MESSVLGYLFAGLATGSLYAIAAGSLVITYVASGVFNLAFAAMAYSIARVYYELHVAHGWPILPAAVVSILVVAPLLGTLLYGVLFRFLQGGSTLVKLMATLGLSVALPPIVDLIFGKLADVTAVGLAPQPLHVFHVFGTTINADQMTMYAALVLVLLLGTVVMRFTDVGLKVRALVDSGALTSLSGTSPSKVSMGVWAVSATLAGLTGVLIAPTSGLSSGGMTPLMATAFAAIVVARLRSLPIAMLAGLGIGVVSAVPQDWINPNGTFAEYFIPSVPMIFMLAALLIFAVIGETGSSQAGGALDKAIRVDGGDSSVAPSRGLTIGRLPMPLVLSVALVAVVAIFAQVSTVYWTGLAAGGICLGIALLSYTLVTGEGGMLWLCQISFAGIGAIVVAELATNHGWNPILAAIVGPIVVVPVGLLVGALTIRLGELYVALVTLSAGLLAQTLLIGASNRWYNYGSGTIVLRPSWATDNKAFLYLALVAFLVVALVVINVRRSTAGLALGAVRWSENGAKTLGISILQSKLFVSALASYVAAFGGVFLAMNWGSTAPLNWDPFNGLVWLAVLMTLGSRSVMAALLTGLLYFLIPGVFSTWLPASLGDVPTVLFGLGAVSLASHPEGAFAQNAAMIMSRRAKRAAKRGTTPGSGVASAAPAAVLSTSNLPQPREESSVAPHL
jgi:branched-chain amino acid transport system permease protein